MRNALLLFLIAISELQGVAVGHEVWLDKHRGPIKVPFQTNGYVFFQGTDGELGLPAEAFLKLVAVKDNRRTILPCTTSLRGYVKLKNDDEALAFVRLFTSVDSHYLFKDSLGIEIRHVQRPPLVVKYATMSMKPFKDLRLFDPRVRKTAKGSFVIERFVLTPKGKIVRTEETVEPNGSYTAKVIMTLGRNAEMTFPIYE